MLAGHACSWRGRATYRNHADVEYGEVVESADEDQAEYFELLIHLFKS